MSNETENVALVKRFWEALKQRDFDAVGAFMADDGHYVDVPVKDVDEGARGPAETAARLRLGLAPLAGYELHDGNIAASGDFVITEHSETRRGRRARRSRCPSPPSWRSATARSTGGGTTWT